MKLQHLSSIHDLSREQVEGIFQRADVLAKLSSDELSQRLTHRFLGNLFFEPSTRTRLAFETAAKRLGMHVLTVQESSSSRVKGETFLDTLLTLEAMGTEVFVIRTKDEQVANNMATKMNTLHPHTHIINAGGGTKDHPTQGLLDVYTMQKHFAGIQECKVCIVGDIKHSRVARSTVQCLQLLGVKKIHLVAPKDLLPDAQEFQNCEMGSDIDAGIEKSDVVMALRIQKERMKETSIPDTDDYHRQFGINFDRLGLANPNAIIMHPGPMNRGIEISHELADSPRAVITEQVKNGVLVRMAILDLMLSKSESKPNNVYNLHSK